ncbi:MAG: hypothetical protein GEV28_00175 [Actinophytocola sp.]|uniref:hypothetical protein n=1 Tax=Actinophytocola sp. TaxID=1872138 RepID=UPI0013295384|nr:hypothetical protein [Actinophytocola sp.]MPZ78887.1 hypothetical protein [Actinophytocola sp.]
MSAATTVWRNDLRNVVRDRTIGILLAVPLGFLAMLRFGYPIAERQLSLDPSYRADVLAVFCLISATFPAFVTAFIMLDEKDAGLIAVLRVLPVSPALLLGYRLLVVAVFSAFYPLILIGFTGLSARPLPEVLVLGLLCALGSPAATLLVVATAANKIVGLAMFKGLFFLLGFTIVCAVFPGWWTVVAAVVPTFWIASTFGATSTSGFFVNAAVAVVFHLLVIVLAYRRFRRQITT